MEHNEICKVCGRKLVVKATKRTAAQLKKPYYYTAYYFCQHCQKLYHDNKFKVVNNQLELSSWSDNDHDRISSVEDSIAPLQNDNAKYDVQIWTDGACTNNGYPNAKAAWGFVSGKTEKAGLVVGKQTNNIAEGLAILNALKWSVEKGHKKIQLHTDSQISLHNLAKPARLVKMNREIFEEIEKVIAQNDLKVTYVKVIGHSGDINNERADKICNELASKN